MDMDNCVSPDVMCYLEPYSRTCFENLYNISYDMLTLTFRYINTYLYIIYFVIIFIELNTIFCKEWY